MTIMNRYHLAMFMIFLALPFVSMAQGAGDPLTFQGMSQSVFPDVRGAGMGSATIASGRTASALFSNPAGLASIDAIDVRIGGVGISSWQRQAQEWIPNRMYAGLSILMEDKWAGIKDPLVFNPADSTYS